MDYITINQWLSVNKDTRQKMKEIFYIRGTGMVEVVTDEFGHSTIKQDGHTNTDLQVITIEKLRDFVGSAAADESIYDLWKRAIEKIERPEVLGEKEAVAPVSHEATGNLNTSDHPLRCDQCPFTTGSATGLKVHKHKHNRTKV